MILVWFADEGWIQCECVGVSFSTAPDGDLRQAATQFLRLLTAQTISRHSFRFFLGPERRAAKSVFPTFPAASCIQFKRNRLNPFLLSLARAIKPSKITLSGNTVSAFFLLRLLPLCFTQWWSISAALLEVVQRHGLRVELRVVGQGVGIERRLHSAQSKLALVVVIAFPREHF